MQRAYQLENKVMENAFRELKSNPELSSRLKDELVKVFGERFTNGWELAKSRRVRKYEFKPSGRSLWTAHGRKGEYQVIAEIPFCYCDDYYFRVMDKKRGLCYHIIAQRIAEALNQFERVPKSDSQYSSVTDRWRAREATEISQG